MFKKLFLAVSFFLCLSFCSVLKAVDVNEGYIKDTDWILGGKSKISCGLVGSSKFTGAFRAGLRYDNTFYIEDDDGYVYGGTFAGGKLTFEPDSDGIRSYLNGYVNRRSYKFDNENVYDWWIDSVTVKETGKISQSATAVTIKAAISASAKINIQYNNGSTRRYGISLKITINGDYPVDIPGNWISKWDINAVTTLKYPDLKIIKPLKLSLEVGSLGSDTYSTYEYILNDVNQTVFQDQLENLFYRQKSTLFFPFQYTGEDPVVRTNIDSLILDNAGPGDYFQIEYLREYDFTMSAKLSRKNVISLKGIISFYTTPDAAGEGERTYGTLLITGKAYPSP